MSEDGSLLAVGPYEQGVVRVFDVDEKRQVAEIEIEALGGIPAFLSNDRLAVQEFLDGRTLSVYGLGDGAAEVEMTVELPTKGGALEISPDGSTLLAMGALKEGALLLDAATLEQITPVITTRGSDSRDLFFDADGGRAGWSSDDGSVTIIDTADGREVATVTGLSGDQLITEFTGDQSLVSASQGTGRAVAWTLGERSAIGAYQAVDGDVFNVKVISDNEMVTSIGASVVVSPVGQPSSPTVMRTFGPDTSFIIELVVNEHAGVAAVFASDVDDTGQEIDHRIHLVDLADLTDLTDRSIVELGDGFVGALAFSPDGTRLAVGQWDGRLMIVDVATGRTELEPMVVDEDGCCLTTLVWNADGSRLHTGGSGGVLYTFDTSTWEKVSEHPLTPDFGLRRAWLVPGGDQLVVPSDGGAVFLADAMSGEPIGEPFIAGGTKLSAAILVRDGAQLAATSSDGRLRLWDVATRRSIGPPLAGHEFSQTLALDPEGSLITGGYEGAIIRWDLDPASWVAKACELAGRNLTREEWDRYVEGDYAPTCPQWPAGT